MVDRVCCGVQVPDPQIGFPSMVVSVPDGDMMRLQNSVAAAMPAQQPAHGDEMSNGWPSHVCHGCTPSVHAAAAFQWRINSGICAHPTTGATLLPGAKYHAQTTSILDVVEGHENRAAAYALEACSNADYSEPVIDRANILSLDSTFADPSAATCDTAGGPSSPSVPSRRLAVDDPVSGRVPMRSKDSEAHEFVAGHGGGLFDIMAWYMHSRCLTLPPSLPRCLPFSVTITSKPAPHNSMHRRSGKHMQGVERGKTHLRLKGHQQGIKSFDRRLAEGANAVHQAEHAVTVEAKATITGVEETSFQRGSSSRGCGRGNSVRVAHIVQHGRVQKGGAKKRGGRLVRELAATDAADKDGMVELGFNAHLKYFEKVQREKGVFKNRQKPRPSVYTVSGVPHNE
eukprot:jgi/Ulvmu1/12009/UM083_0022.1